MKKLTNNELEYIKGGDLDGVMAVACAGVVIADTAWYLGLFVPTYGAVLVVASLGCAAYGLANA